MEHAELTRVDGMINYLILHVKIDQENRKEIYLCHLFIQQALIELSLLFKRYLKRIFDKVVSYFQKQYSGYRKRKTKLKRESYITSDVTKKRSTLSSFTRSPIHPINISRITSTVVTT